MVVYHKHHIIPKHMGGLDDSSNLVLLTIEEHAEAHKKLWEEYNKYEDYVAWKALSSSIGKDEIYLEKRRLGGINSTKNGRNPFSSLSGEAISKRVSTRKERYGDKAYNEKAIQAALSVESREKRKKTYKEIGHQQGEKHSQYGTCWITNGIENKKIKKDELDIWISLGYYKGRIFAPRAR